MLSYQTQSRVIYGDTDRMGYAYNANYLRWFEMGRSELFRHLGLTYREIESRGIFLPVSEVHCKFIAPVQYDDILLITTSIDTSVRAAMKFDYHLYNAEDNSDVAVGYTKHACVEKNGRLVRPPKFLRDFIKQKMDEFNGKN